MTELVSGSTAIANLYGRMGWYRSSPARISQATYDFMDEVLKGQVDLVDPTNPFIMGMEMSAFQSASAVNENLINQRRTYATLAQTDDEIYRHMTNLEYRGRFSRPGFVNFKYIMALQELYNALKPEYLLNDTSGQYELFSYRGTIPRDTTHTIDGLVFTNEYPIEFRLYPNTNVLQITYNVEIPSPISTPTNNVIKYTVRQNEEGVKWLYFDVPVKQMLIETVYTTIQKNSIFRKDLPFNNEFLYARVFNKSEATVDDTGEQQWVELYTTHSDQIFDIKKPTAVFTVTTGNINITIPYIYLTQGVLTGQIRMDVYTTQGNISTNLSTYALDLFQTQFRSINEKRDTDDFTEIWGQVSTLVFSTDAVSGGQNGKTFREIQTAVINYSTGVNEIPITAAQLDALSDVSGFTIIRNADPMTNRLFICMRTVPTLGVLDARSGIQQRVNRIGTGIVRFSTNLAALRENDNVVTQQTLDPQARVRITMLSGTVFDLNNGLSSIVSRGDIQAQKALPLNTLVNVVNDKNYVYTPYYYVFDPANQLIDIRPYDLDRPSVTDLNFVRQNQSLKLPVNTGSYNVEKKDFGYLLTVKTSSDVSYKGLSDFQVQVQLRIQNTEGTKIGYINGTLVNTEVDRDAGDERIYEFRLESSHDINGEHEIQIVNANYLPTISNPSIGFVSSFYVPLKLTGDLLYTTSSIDAAFVPDETDALVNKATLTFGQRGNSHDTIGIHLGDYLDHLWTRVRTYAGNETHQKSTVDVFMRYTEDVYEKDPVSGSIFLRDGLGNIVFETTGPNAGKPRVNLLHSQGDTVYDTSGNVVYKYRVGDDILDNYGEPLVLDTTNSLTEFDIFVLDGKLPFVTDTTYAQYQNQLIKLLTRWITVDILDVQARLLERTKALFYPETTVGLMQLREDDLTYTYADAEQSLKAVVYADQSVIADPEIQNNVSTQIINFLNESIRNKKYTVTQLENKLRVSLGSSVYGVSLSGFGGAADYQSVVVKDEQHRLSIKKKLTVLPNNIITLVDDVDIRYQTF